MSSYDQISKDLHSSKENLNWMLGTLEGKSFEWTSGEGGLAELKSEFNGKVGSRFTCSFLSPLSLYISFCFSLHLSLSLFPFSGEQCNNGYVHVDGGRHCRLSVTTIQIHTPISHNRGMYIVL